MLEPAHEELAPASSTNGYRTGTMKIRLTLLCAQNLVKRSMFRKSTFPLTVYRSFTQLGITE
jgi:hypothetical protein